MSQENLPTYKKRVSWIAHVIVSIIILVVAFSIVAMMFSSKPETKRWGGNRPAPSVAVEVAELRPESYEVWIDSYGTAEALTKTNLVSDVNARVVEVTNSIRTGKTFKKGELLVKLEDKDFIIEVDIAASAAADANVRYLQELAEADLAAQQWNERPDSDAARLLSLRKPQVEAAKAALDAANARLEKAKLNVKRTEIRAPFNGMVLRQMVDVGQVVSPSQTIAEIYSTSAVEVRLPIKLSDLEQIDIPTGNGNLEPNALPQVQFYSQMGQRQYVWNGNIVRSEGAFDPSTRMLYLVAQVDDPFLATPERPSIRVGQFLQAKIQGIELSDVFVIPRRAITQDNKISIAQEGFLKKISVSPLWTDSENVVISASLINNEQGALSENDQLILTPTANLLSGTKVRPINQSVVSTRPSPASSTAPSAAADSSSFK